MNDAPCPYCKGKSIYPYGQIASLGLFESSLKDLVHQMKYHRRWGIGEDLAAFLAELPRVQRIMDDAEVVVPIPLWRWRQVSRGYNQADIIARALAARFGKKVSRPVRRVRKTVSQTQLRSAKSRIDNVHGAFSLRSSRLVANRNVVVIDDVMTSAATLKEVGRTLLEAKPGKLSAIVLAVADPRGRGFEAI